MYSLCIKTTATTTTTTATTTKQQLQSCVEAIVNLLFCFTGSNVDFLREAEVDLASDNCGYSTNFLCVKDTDTSTAGACTVSLKNNCSKFYFVQELNKNITMVKMKLPAWLTNQSSSFSHDPMTH